MEIKKHIIYKGEKLPLVYSPITKTELLNLQNKYDKFLFKSSSNNRIVVISNQRGSISHTFNMGFKPIFYSFISVFTIWKILSTTKKVKKAIKSPFKRKNEKEMRDFMNSMKNPDPSKTPIPMNGKIKKETQSK